MHKLYDLKERLIKELEEKGSRSDMNQNDLQYIDTLAHAAKNVCKIIEYCEDDDVGSGYSEKGMYFRSGGRSVRRSTENRYYRTADDVSAKLEKMMRDAPDEETRSELRRILNKLESM